MRRKLLLLAVISLLTASTAIAATNTWNSALDWQQAPDWSGVTWDGILDHPNDTVQQGYRYGDLQKGLIAYYKMDEGSGQFSNDSALDHGGILGGSSASQSTDPIWTTSSKIGSHALDFDGSDDYVDVSDDDSLEGMDELTISSWINADSIDHETHVEIARKQDSYLLSFQETGSQLTLGVELTAACIAFEGHENIIGDFGLKSF